MALCMQGARGNTPLHYACLLEKEKHAAMLMKYNANPFLLNQYGQRPYDMIPKDAVASTRRLFRQIFQVRCLSIEILRVEINIASRMRLINVMNKILRDLVANFLVDQSYDDNISQTKLYIIAIRIEKYLYQRLHSLTKTSKSRVYQSMIQIQSSMPHATKQRQRILAVSEFDQNHSQSGLKTRMYK